MKTEWEKAQEFEKNWHNNQQFNTYNEETKQYTYASLMGLDEYKTNHFNQSGWDFGDKYIIDIGGGEQSILLKSKAKERTVIDPCKYPEWTMLRYKEAGIKFCDWKGEDIPTENIQVDMCFIYNCLQHTEDPEKIIQNAKKMCKTLHIFEWIDIGLSEGHIHNLKEEELNKWLGGIGQTKQLNQDGLLGRCYFGVFLGSHYGE